MTFLMWNILLALSWAGLTEEVTAMNLTVGLVRLFRIAGDLNRNVRVLPRLAADAISHVL